MLICCAVVAVGNLILTKNTQYPWKNNGFWFNLSNLFGKSGADIETIYSIIDDSERQPLKQTMSFHLGPFLNTFSLW